MTNFEDMGPLQLRKLLADTIINNMGRDFALGWLQSAFAYGVRDMDNDREHLIEQIRKYSNVSLVA